MELIIKTENLTKIYNNVKDNKPAVKNLNLEVPKGEVFGFLGPNGAGKTTTIYLLLGILKPTSGKGQLLGKPLGDREAKKKLGFLPESVNLHTHHTGLSLLYYYGELLEMEKKKIKSRSEEVLEQVGLKKAQNQLISTYSKGMIQRLGLAQALINEPDLLILDEPTANMDPIGRKEVKDLLLTIKDQNKTIFISSHILAEVESMCDRACILKEGQIVREGTIKDLTMEKGKTIIRSKGLSNEAIEKIKALGVSTSVIDGENEITLENKNQEFDIIEIIRKSDCPLISISQSKNSLEDIFYSAVKGE